MFGGGTASTGNVRRVRTFDTLSVPPRAVPHGTGLLLDVLGILPVDVVRENILNQLVPVPTAPNELFKEQYPLQLVNHESLRLVNQLSQRLGIDLDELEDQDEGVAQAALELLWAKRPRVTQLRLRHSQSEAGVAMALVHSGGAAARITELRLHGHAASSTLTMLAAGMIALYCQNLQSLCISWENEVLFDDGFLIPIGRCAKLTKLTLQGSDAATHAHLCHITSICGLRHLEITTDAFAELEPATLTAVGKMTKLTHLELSGVLHEAPWEALTCFGELKQLQRLRLPFIREPDNATVAIAHLSGLVLLSSLHLGGAVLSPLAFESVRRLDLTRLEGLHGIHMGDTCPPHGNLPRLKHLGAVTSDEGLLNVLTPLLPLGALHELWFKMDDYVIYNPDGSKGNCVARAAALTRAIEHLLVAPSLHRVHLDLHIDQDASHDDEACPMLVLAPRLTSLSVTNSSHVAGVAEDLLPFLKYCPALEGLTFECVDIQDAHLLLVVEWLPQLKFFVLKDCLDVTVDGLLAMAAACGHPLNVAYALPSAEDKPSNEMLNSAASMSSGELVKFIEL